ncbi:MAG: TolC family protein [Bacteroidales bacterium]|nr:TolC family protein [Bacteroidales bacterium]
MKALLLVLALAAGVGEEDMPDFSRPWTLRQCTEWAMDHNLTVARQENNVAGREIEQNTSHWSWLPSVSAQASENFNFGRGIGGDNTYERGNSSTTGFSVGANMSLFDGGAIYNQIRLSNLNLEAAVADLEKARDDIRVSVAKAYVQILYNYEIRDVARQQIAIDSMQVARLEQMFASGRSSAAEVSQQKATLAQSQVTLVQAENNVRSSLLELAQLLELVSWEGFSIERPSVSMEEIAIGHPDDIYADALGIRPAIRAEQIRLEGTKRSLAIAKSAYYPTLTLSGGGGTNYYTSFDAISFWDQLQVNFSQYVGLSLSIPIFSKFSIRNRVRTANLNIHTQELALRQAENSLYKEIQQAWNSAVNARAKWDASQQALSAAEDSFTLTQAKYENGKATVTEFNESRNRLMKSRSDAVQATYEYLFQTRLVNFYRGSSLDF